MMPTKKNPEEPKKGKKLLANPLATGSGAAIVAVVATLAARDSRALLETLQHFGGPWLIGIVVVVLANQGFQRIMDVGERMVQAQKENAASQQSLAEAVRRIADTDDRERIEQRRLLSFVGSQQERILEKFDEISQRLGEKAKGAHA